MRVRIPWLEAAQGKRNSRTYLNGFSLEIQVIVKRTNSCLIWFDISSVKVAKCVDGWRLEE